MAWALACSDEKDLVTLGALLKRTAHSRYLVHRLCNALMQCDRWEHFAWVVLNARRRVLASQFEDEDCIEWYFAYTVEHLCYALSHSDVSVVESLLEERRHSSRKYSLWRRLRKLDATWTAQRLSPEMRALYDKYAEPARSCTLQ